MNEFAAYLSMLASEREKFDKPRAQRKEMQERNAKSLSLSTGYSKWISQSRL
jgi:hypothetical protein